ncbi:MAG: HU family DNA-binding protein [Bacteroidaceae bacterium]|nr:HU family DNA-binding protein [Bacteroidaceae bacterium]
MAIKFRPVAKKNPMTKEVKYYAQAVTADRITVDRIAREIEESCTVHESDIRAVIAAFTRRIIVHLQDGHSINLGDLGNFRVSVRSTPCDVPDEVTADSVRAARVVYAPSGVIRRSVRPTAAGVRFQRAAK